MPEGREHPVSSGLSVAPLACDRVAPLALAPWGCVPFGQEGARGRVIGLDDPAGAVSRMRGGSELVSHPASLISRDPYWPHTEQ